MEAGGAAVGFVLDVVDLAGGGDGLVAAAGPAAPPVAQDDGVAAGRTNTITTRNARLAAIRSLFRYAALQAPEHAAVISRVLAIPPKRSDRAIVCFLDAAEIDALLAAPGQHSWLARRDHALLLTAVQTGLGVSELTGLTTGDIHLGPGPHVRCHGKGRNDRATPLTRQTVAVLRVWLAERRGGPGDPLFPTRAGHPLSRDATLSLANRMLWPRYRACCKSLLGVCLAG